MRLLAGLAIGFLLGIGFPPSVGGQELRPEFSPVAVLDGGRVNWIGGESPDGRFVLYSAVSGEGSGSIRVYDRAADTSRAVARGVVAGPWSPRGDWIAYVRTSEDGSGMEVWTMPVDSETGEPTGQARRVSLRDARGPEFSPDGTSLAYTLLPITKSDAPRLARVPVTGGRELVLTRAPGWAQMLRWSPDGRWIYYRYNPRPGQRPRYLARVPADGGEPEILRPIFDFFGISPDGDFYAFQPDPPVEEGRARVGVATTDGIEVGEFRVPSNLGLIRWGGRGNRLLGLRTPVYTAVRVVELSSGTVRRISVGEESRDGRPAWSPDGARLAYVSFDGDQARLTVAAADGSSHRHVPVDDPPGSQLRWAPDGRHLAYLSGDPPRLVAVDAEAAVSTELARLSSRDARFRWEEGGGAVLYVRRPGDGTGPEIRRATLAGHDTGVRALAPFLDGDAALRFADDTTVVAVTARHVTVVSLRRGEPRRVYTAEEDEELADDLTTLPDQGRAAFMTYGSEKNGFRATLRVVDLTDGEVRSVQPGRLVPNHFVWHPDGQHLVVRASLGAAPDQRLYLMPLDGSPPQEISLGERPRPALGDVFDLSPDGSRVAFTSTRRGDTTLWEVDLSRSLAPYLAEAER